MIKLDKKFWIMLEAIMLMIWIITTILFVYAVFSDGAKCLANPILFGVKFQSKTVDFSCKCNFDNQPNILYTFDKNKESVSSGNNYLNFSR
jgi:hypothetical protein